MKNKKVKKLKRYPGFKLVKNPDGSDTSHLLDSLWISEDGSELKIVFATGKVLSHKPI